MFNFPVCLSALLSQSVCGYAKSPVAAKVLILVAHLSPAVRCWLRCLPAHLLSMLSMQKSPAARSCFCKLFGNWCLVCNGCTRNVFVRAFGTSNSSCLQLQGCDLNHATFFMRAIDVQRMLPSINTCMLTKASGFR